MRVARADSFRGRFTLPGDKSLSHRLAILGAIADGETQIGNFSSSADCSATLSCLSGLGIESRRVGRSVDVLGRGRDGMRAAEGPLDAANSGSTLRMLAGLAAGLPFETVLTGDESLRRRPVERVAAPLRAMGASVATTQGKPPITVRGGSLTGVTWTLDVASAQVKTAVLLAGLFAHGPTTVVEPAASRDHTERLLPAFGVDVMREGLSATIDGGQTLHPVTMEVPGDTSSAAFLVVAAVVLPNSSVRIENVLLNPQRTAFLEVLRRMGAHVETGLRHEDPEPVGWIEARSSHLSGTDVPPEWVPGLIDEVPALAVAAACAEGVFTLSGAAELRVKESDRIAAIVEGLGRMGCEIHERPDGLLLSGGRPLRGAAVRSFGDHRIAMALGVAGLTASGETEIDDADCAAVSFPEFWDVLRRGTRGEA